MKKPFVFLLGCCLLAACGAEPLVVNTELEAIRVESEVSSVASSAQPSVTLRSPAGNEVRIQVEIADDDAERQRGLMFRESLPEGQGMLFVFDQPMPLAFWMKNTLIPLDILYFDAGGELVSALTMEPCTADPCPSYPSGESAKFALEVSAGFNQQHGVGEGWRMER